MNPCPCGYFSSPTHECSCTVMQIQKYRSKISGPLLDRIDIHIEVPAVPFRELSKGEAGTSSEVIRQHVQETRQIQQRRFEKKKDIFCNAHMRSKEIRKICVVDSACEALLNQAITRLGLSARAYDRILKLSRTIADLEGSEAIRPEYVSEAIQYRSLDRDFSSLM